MWSRKPMPVAMSETPVPSRLSRALMLVSRVLRSTVVSRADTPAARTGDARREAFLALAFFAGKGTPQGRAFSILWPEMKRAAPRHEERRVARNRPLRSPARHVGFALR